MKRKNLKKINVIKIHQEKLMKKEIDKWIKKIFKEAN